MGKKPEIRRIFSISAFRRNIDADVDDELRFHLDRRTEDLVRSGWSEEGARIEAMRVFGDLDEITEECRAMDQRHARRRGVMDRLGGWVQDLRFAVRQLGRHKAFAAVAILTLALGVGATTSIFSVVNGVILRPLPYSNPDELVRVWVGADRGNMSAPDFGDIETRLPSVESLVGLSSSTATLTGLGEPRLLSGTRVSGSLQEVFRVTPRLGRDIRGDEWGPDAARVVVISHALWQSLFAGAEDVLGRTMDISGVTREIVGVAPAGFEYPGSTEVWYPRRVDPDGCGRGCHTWNTIGRLAEGSTLETVQAELDALASALSETYPESNFGKTFRVVGLQRDMVGDVSQGLWILLGAVAAVLLIACANVANLLLVRSSDRSGEMAVRGALGATARRLMRQTIVESSVLAALGGGLGLALTVGAVALLQRVSTTTIPRIEQVSVDGMVLLFALVIVSIVTLLFGASPALRGGRIPIATSLYGAGRGVHGSGNRRRRRTLVTVEMGLSVVLLVAAGLLMRTLGQLYSVDLGYQSENLERFSLSLPAAAYPTLGEVRTFYRTLESRLAELPGVESVGSAFGAPLGRTSMSGEVLVEGRPEPEPGQATAGSIKSVSPDYLATMRIPVIRGRGLEASDDVDALPVAVVNEVFVRENFPDVDPIGQRVSITADFGFGAPTWTIVGVARSVRSRSVTEDPVAEIYVPHGQFGPGFMTVTLLTSVGAGSVTNALRSEVRRMDPNLPVRGLETVEQAIASDVAPTRFYLLLVSIFAGLAVALAAVGLYGVLSYLVVTRTQEIGVRVALGADRVRITRMGVLEGLRPVMVGVVGGLLLSLAAGRAMEAVLFGVDTRDPAVLVSVPLVLALVALLAAWVPAHRAAGMDPSSALKSD